MASLTLEDVRRDWASPPNWLTYLRIALTVPAFLLVLQLGLAGWVGLGCYAAAVITDKIDGIVARRNNGALITKLGKVLDPFADKLLTVIVMVAVTQRVEDSLRLPVAITLATIVLRELLVAYVRSKQVVTSASEAGRASMVALSVALVVLITPAFTLSLGSLVISWERQELAIVMMLGVAVGASLTSGWQYWANRHQGRE